MYKTIYIHYNFYYIIFPFFFSVCPRNPAWKDPSRIGSGYRVYHVRPFGGSRSFGRFPLCRQGSDSTKKWNVHVGDGLLWNRKQPGHQEVAARCCKNFSFKERSKTLLCWIFFFFSFSFYFYHPCFSFLNRNIKYLTTLYDEWI